MQKVKSYYVDVNRALWDGWAEIHFASPFYDVEGFKQGHSTLGQYELAGVGNVAGKTLLHLQCHFGLDTLSWVRLGAHYLMCCMSNMTSYLPHMEHYSGCRILCPGEKSSVAI